MATTAHRHSPCLGLLAALAGALVALPAAATPPARARLFASGLNLPVGIAPAPGEAAHLFAVDLAGRIMVLDAVTGAASPTPFLDMHAQVGREGDGGLLGFCFDPSYQTNGFFYVFYNATPDPPNDRVLARYHAAPGSLVADAESSTVLLRYSRVIGHNGGWIGFGPQNGYLYLSTGDSGTNGTFDAPNNAQTLTNNPQGKILRVDVRGDDFPADPQRNYLIPPTNPFASGGGDPEIWSYGLRNPWRCALDSATGDFYIASNGEDERETIYFEPPTSTGARNYGWRCTEGTRCTGLSGCTCGSPSLTPPVHEYPHAVGHSIIGGVVYRGAAIPAYQGRFFFADFIDHQIWSIRIVNGAATDLIDHTAEFALPGGNHIENVSTFGVDGAGEMLIADLTGSLYRIVPYAVCPADFNGAHGLEVQDIFDYLNAWFAGNPRADFDGLGGITVQDIFAFLNAWFSGCA